MSDFEPNSKINRKISYIIFGMSKISGSIYALRAISRMKQSVAVSAANIYTTYSLEDEDVDECIRMSDVAEVLENLGARLNSNEIHILTKGIQEDKQSGILYEDFASVVLFTSFFNSCFNRQGEGLYSTDDLKEVMTNIKLKRRDGKIEQQQEETRIRHDIDVMIQESEIDPRDGIDYDETITLIEKNRLVLSMFTYIRYIVIKIIFIDAYNVEIYSYQLLF